MCILEAQVCDGRPQCQDWSDEKDCRRPTKTCEFRCADGSRCIPKKFVCDGETDCPDGTDEFGCGRNFQGCVIELTAVLPLSFGNFEGFLFQFLLLPVRRYRLLNRLASVRHFFVGIHQTASLNISCAMDAETVLTELMKTTVGLCVKIRVGQFTRH